MILRQKTSTLFSANFTEDANLNIICIFFNICIEEGKTLQKHVCEIENRRFIRVPNRFFGIRDLAFLKVGIRDFSGKER